MRTIMTSLVLAVPLLAATPSYAQNFVDQAQRFLGNDQASRDRADREAYERGRNDEYRQQQTERDRRRDQRDAQRNQDRYYGNDRPSTYDYGNNYGNSRR